MLFTSLPLAGAYQVEPEVYNDDRGLFYRFFCANEFKKIGHAQNWVQINQSFTAKAGTIRGMHFQLPPHSEIKLVKCIAGKIFDVIIDIREQSSTFLQWVGVELSAENKKIMYIPEGFAHGFQTLTNDCELSYHHSAFYKTEYEGGFRFDDPRLNISWPLSLNLVSERDKNHPLIAVDFKGIKIDNAL